MPTVDRFVGRLSSEPNLQTSWYTTRVTNHIPFLETLKRGEERRFQASLKRFNDAVQELVDRTLADPARAASQTSMIHALMANEKTRDPKNVRDQVITMMFAKGTGGGDNGSVG